MKSTAQAAAEQLRYLVFHRDHDREVLANPALMGQLMQQVRSNCNCHINQQAHVCTLHTA
jgi:hypothetical protein